jgi:hypothetical protein
VALIKILSGGIDTLVLKELTSFLGPYDILLKHSIKGSDNRSQMI